MPYSSNNDRKNKNIPSINYLNKDFISIKNDLMKYVQAYFPNTYRDFNETSPGMMLMELNAYVGDVLSFYIDQQFKEVFINTVEERPNIMNLAKTLGYKVKPIVPSLVELTFTQNVATTGTAPNIAPDMEQAMVLNKGMSIQSDINEVSFETLDIVDFTITGSASHTATVGPYQPEVYSQDASTGIANKFTLKQKVIAVSGYTKQETFTISSPKKFMRLTLTDKDVVSIISITDSNGKNWYEVDHLAQDKIYNEVHWTSDGSRTAYVQELSGGTTEDISVPVPSRLNDMIKVNRRFITETNSDNTTSIVFGNGLIRGSLDDTSFIEDVFNNANEVNAFIQGSLPSVLTPASSYNSLGESPSNTTLTVKYRVGGGSNANVSAGSANTILAKSILSSDTTQEGSLTVTNEVPAAGGSDMESIEQIREKTKSNFVTQARAVTREDYESRISAMPSRFGSIAKVYVRRNENIGDQLDVSVFDLDSSGALGDAGDVTEFDNWITQIAADGGIPDPGEDSYGTYTAIKNWI